MKRMILSALLVGAAVFSLSGAAFAEPWHHHHHRVYHPYYRPGYAYAPPPPVVYAPPPPPPVYAGPSFSLTIPLR
ncbi:MAG TPA: hypothetical protein VHX19_16715 [Stellaceae bacterium]|jgi:hypothetical protein|nr:hypothetical protein [Stellaceae bacterium]